MRGIYILIAALLAGIISLGWTRPDARELTGFQFRQLDRKTGAPEGEFMAAKVPGDVISDLVACGKLPDPYLDFNSLEAQWVNDWDWLYRTGFTLDPKPGQRAFLMFMGVDYFSRIQLNKNFLAEHEGMFSRIPLEATDVLLKGAENRLDVTLFGIPDHPAEKYGPAILGLSEIGRRRYLKTEMSFGWDFAPRLKGAGIWDRVLLFETGKAMIRDITVRSEIDGAVKVILEMDSSCAAPGRLRMKISGETFEGFAEEESFEVDLPAGQSARTFEMRVDRPRLWWPWDMGKPELYRLEIEVIIGGEVSDRAVETFGFREIAWERSDDAEPHHADWILLVNGRREFMRGANMVPAESLHGRLTDARYERLVKAARDANINALRIWGGGNRERAGFYHACDREGILVWQEFPFACVYLIGVPGDRKFLELVRQEAGEMTRQLRNHPSLFMWCGGNEFNVRKAREAVAVMEEVTRDLDPTRRFIPASPYRGDTHNWMVWHQRANLEAYFIDTSPLPSEFGLQAFPPIETLRKYISGDLLWPIGDVHVHHNLGREKMDKYASAIIPGGEGAASGIEEYINASQTIQAHYLQRGIEFWRQRKYSTSGTFFWQLNEPWPSICWSVIDYEFRPKPAYEQIRDTYNPLLVSAQFEDREWTPGEEFSAKIYLVNDLHRGFDNIRTEVRICGEPVKEFMSDAPPDSVSSPGGISISLPAGQVPVLELLAFQSDKMLAKNRYDLSIHDPVAATRSDYVALYVGRWLMTGQRPRASYLDPLRNRN